MSDQKDHLIDNQDKNSRRDFLRNVGLTALGAGLVSSVQAAGLPEIITQAKAKTLPTPKNTEGYTPVTTLNGWTLPYRLQDGVKEFHLVAESVKREMAPGMVANMWGYNGQSPGPTIECVEGDRVRIFVTNKLPEHTSVHWHGVLLPSGMDGVSGMSQPAIKPGETYVYEFTMGKSGTFLYHPHADEMVQVAMGMMGGIVVHPKDPAFMRVDRDYFFLMSAYAIDPGAATPRVMEMTDFNLWTFNSRVFPGIDPLVARTGERVRIRVGNLTMTNHPIHLHGHSFEVTSTGGGWIPESARWPEVTVDIGVGQVRTFEFDAVVGDWALHCHKSHHTMNAMGHNVPTMIGVQQKELSKKIRKLVPDYMGMGKNGMADMSGMSEMMPLPENTLPMMTGEGPFGALEMGGMFTVLKVRDDLEAGDYGDPGWYSSPAGTQAYLYKGDAPVVSRAPSSSTAASTVQVKKPGHNQHE